MDIRELELFIAVAEERNFRAAADRLHMTQPPLTRAIAKMEHDLGVKLFERTTRKVELTPAGIRLFDEAGDIINKVGDLKRAVLDVANLKKGVINIGITHTVLRSTACKSIWKFKEDNPGTKVNISEGTVENQLKRLEKGKIDLAIVHSPQHPGPTFNHAVLDQEELGVLVPEGHRLYNRKKIKISDLAKETLIMHPRREGQVFYKAVLKLFRTSKVDVDFYFKKTNQNCCLLASNGEGLLLTTASMYKFAVPWLKLVPIENELTKLSIVAYWADEKKVVTNLFVSFLRNQNLIIAPKSPCLMSLANW